MNGRANDLKIITKITRERRKKQQRKNIQPDDVNQNNNKTD